MIFISSPYSSENPETVDLNYRVAAIVAADFCYTGHAAISPIVYGPQLISFKKMPNSWEFWSNFCLSILQMCDRMIVLQMPGWKESSGVQSEIAFALKRNIPIIYFKIKNPAKYVEQHQNDRQL